MSNFRKWHGRGAGKEPKSPIRTIVKLARVVRTETLESNSPCHHGAGGHIHAQLTIAHV
jgi:hypothetical protein